MTDHDRGAAEEIVYALYAVFRATGPLGDQQARQQQAAEVDSLLDQAQSKGVTTRGTYDVGGYRADADVMFWWTGASADDLQDLYRRVLATGLGGRLQPVWSGLGLTRPAEFSPDHRPAFVREEPAKAYACVYPYNRSLEWYLLPEFERRGLLAEHGVMGREFPDVLANTVAAFGLGDYEWLLCFEADRPERIVDCLRRLRAARARLHTRLEVPFYTGARKPVGELVRALP